MGAFNKIKEKLKKLGGSDSYSEEFADDYVEIDSSAESKMPKNKVMIRSFVIEDFSDIKSTIDSLREGYTIALVNIGPIKDKDLVELKRAVNKLKKTCDAMEGDIAGFGEDWLVITPSFAQIYRNKEIEDVAGGSEE